MPTKNSTYIILGLILLILSGIGGYFLFQTYQSNQSATYTAETTPKIELLPTDSPDEETSEVTPSASTSASIITPIASVSGKVTPTKIPTKIPTKTPTKAPSITSTPTPTSTVSSSTLVPFTSEKDGFSLEYSSKRKSYQDTESSGNRYTFYLTSGNFAVHVGLNDKWAWTHPDRQFDQNSLISGQPSFRYDIASQTIVDIQYNSKNYTLQCVHNGNATLKTECETFISSFKLL